MHAHVGSPCERLCFLGVQLRVDADVVALLAVDGSDRVSDLRLSLQGMSKGRDNSNHYRDQTVVRIQ